MHAPTRSKKETDALAEWGLSESDLSRSVELWPDNIAAWNLFCTVSTQWIVGFGGIVGLNYMPLFACMDRMKLSAQEYDWLFGDIRAIESEALAALNRKD